MHTLGRHILAEYHGGSTKLLDDVDFVEECLLDAAKKAGATVINATFHHFAPWGVSGVVVIQESHLAIHTWPEVGYAAVDLFTCGTSVDPWIAHRYLEKAFKAVHSSVIEMLRGQYDLRTQPGNEGSFLAPPRIERDTWFTARADSIALSLKLKGKRLHREESPHQLIEMYESEAFGRFMALDGKLTVAAKDERPYHEMLVHVPMQLLGGAVSSLVIGGGDGGAVRELLRYPELQSIQVVEWDKAVTQVAQRFLPQVAQGLESPRVSLNFSEGLDWLGRSSDDQYDLVIFDLPGHWESKDTKDLRYYWKMATRRLSKQGIGVVSGAAPRFQKETYQRLRSSLEESFKEVFPCLINWPTYPGSLWSFFVVSNQTLKPDQPVVSPPSGLQVYNHAVHRACFALPNDLM